MVMFVTRVVEPARRVKISEVEKSGVITEDSRSMPLMVSVPGQSELIKRNGIITNAKLLPQFQLTFLELQ